MPDHRAATEFPASDGLRVRAVPGEVASVVERLTRALRRRGVELFATIDHAAGARAAGLDLDDEVLLVLGDPAVGTPLMQADPRCGLDLPLRVLVWSDGAVTWLAFQDPALLAERYAVGSGRPTVDRMRGLLEGLADELGAPLR
ncbi:DUF302 domain-containing protein [Geodermatophilus sp. URMC 63]